MTAMTTTTTATIMPLNVAFDKTIFVFFIVYTYFFYLLVKEMRL